MQETYQDLEPNYNSKKTVIAKPYIEQISIAGLTIRVDFKSGESEVYEIEDYRTRDELFKNIYKVLITVGHAVQR